MRDYNNREDVKVRLCGTLIEETDYQPMPLLFDDIELFFKDLYKRISLLDDEEIQKIAARLGDKS